MHDEPLPEDLAEPIMNVMLMQHFPGLPYEYFAEMDAVFKVELRALVAGIEEGRRQIEELRPKR